MRNVPRLLLIAAMATLVLGASAVHAANIKIGVVDINKLISGSPQALAAEKEMQQKFGSRRSALVVQQNKIKALQDKINRNGSVMSAEQLQALQNELDADQQDLSRKESDLQADYTEWHNQKLGEIQQAILQEVQKYAKAHQFNLIVGPGVLYADGTVDVTDQVLAQLQKDYKTPAGSSPSRSK